MRRMVDKIQKLCTMLDRELADSLSRPRDPGGSPFLCPSRNQGFQGFEEKLGTRACSEIEDGKHSFSESLHRGALISNSRYEVELTR
jgi:hypothetical protein